MFQAWLVKIAKIEAHSAPSWLPGNNPMKNATVKVRKPSTGTDCNMSRAGMMIVSARRLFAASVATTKVKTSEATIAASMRNVVRVNYWVSDIRDFAGVALAWARTVFVPAVVNGGLAAVVTELVPGGSVSLAVVLAHPVPRWRVVVPLAAPWVPPGGPGRAAAGMWSQNYPRLWDGIGLGGLIDPACADPSRLYYTGRQPALVGTELPGRLVVTPELYKRRDG